MRWETSTGLFIDLQQERNKLQAGGAFFVGGSALFYPAMEHLIMHGGWLYITGCILVLLAALLGVLTAYEMRKTAAPSAAGRWSDEEATMLSCGAYVVGNVTFIVGSIMFFPRILEAGGPVIRLSAVWLFVLGSCVFLAGALIDLLCVQQAGRATTTILALRSGQSRVRVFHFNVAPF